MTEFEGKIKQLSQLIKLWNLVDVSFKRQFEEFSNKLLIVLGNGANSEKIKRIIESKPCVTFELYKNEFDSEILTNQIILWWDK